MRSHKRTELAATVDLFGTSDNLGKSCFSSSWGNIIKTPMNFALDPENTKIEN